MPLLDLLLGTRRLRRKIDAQTQALEHDIARTKITAKQLRHTAVARLTSPLGLLSATAAGFIAGKIAGHSAPEKKPGQRAIGGIAELTLNTIRAIGLQVVLPLAIEWIQLQSMQKKNKTTAGAVKMDNDTPQKDPQ